MISPLAHVDPSARIGENVTIHPFAFVDADVVIGDGCEIMPYASIIRGTRIGRGNRIYQGAIVGADPQDFRWKGKPSFCTVGDNNVIREHVIINRGFSSDEGTVIGNDCFIMANVHIGHDCRIKGNDVIGNGATFGGGVEVDENTILSSNCILHEGSKVGKWVLIKGGCRITGNVPPYVIIAHNPATYFGINAYVMRKGGFDEETIDDVAKAYRHIYQSGTSVFNALQRVENDVRPGDVRDEIVAFIRLNNNRIVATTVDLE
ncbi:MAG: acyl-ACP--UDP-N-acetylglucosamine O-acyltransferase [Muribaculaceae bacterium]|nr:acyl-ACP--UDP-N-acetylglucosamine O-acyltransferase [Muribaculaceae bacterium]